MPWRLSVLVRYGEGPHISSLSLLPFALGFAFLALRRSRPRMLILSSVFSALLVLTNFYGATALACFIPSSCGASGSLIANAPSLWKAAAIPVLAYALSAFWLTPAYLRITLYNLRYVSQPGNQYSYLLTIALALIYGFASWRLASRRPQAAYFTFVTGSMLFFVLDVLGHSAFNFRVLGEPGRLIPELDMAIILFAAEIMRRLWNRTTAQSRVWRAVILVAAIAPFWPVRHFIRRPLEVYRPEPDYRTRPEYRVSSWVAHNMPDARTFVCSTRFWWDAWFDIAQVGGGSDQGLINPDPAIANWENVTIADPAIFRGMAESARRRCRRRRRSAFAGCLSRLSASLQIRGVLPVLFDDHQGNVVYRVPRRYASLARVVDRSGRLPNPLWPPRITISFAPTHTPAGSTTTSPEPRCCAPRTWGTARPGKPATTTAPSRTSWTSCAASAAVSSSAWKTSARSAWASPPSIPACASRCASSIWPSSSPSTTITTWRG